MEYNVLEPLKNQVSKKPPKSTQKKTSTSRSKSVSKKTQIVIKTTRSSLSRTKSPVKTTRKTMKEKESNKKAPVLKSKPRESPSPSPKASPVKITQLRTRSSRAKESPAKVVNKRKETFGSPQERPKRSRGFQTKQESLNKSPSSSRSTSAKSKPKIISKKGKKSPAKSPKPSPKKIATKKPTPNKKTTANKKPTPKKSPVKEVSSSESSESSESRRSSVSKSMEEEEEEKEEDKKEEKEKQPELPDLSIPDPLTGFIRNEQGKLIRATEVKAEKEIELRKNLDQLLDDDTCQIKIKITSVDKIKAYRAAKGADEFDLEESITSESDDNDEGIDIEGYNLYEDYRILEAAEAFQIVHGKPRGLLGTNVWASITDPTTGEKLSDEEKNPRSLCNRYSKYMIYLSDVEKRAILELGRNKPEYELKKLKCLFQRAVGMKYLTGIYKQRLHKHGPYGKHFVLVISPQDLVKDVKERMIIEEEEKKKEELEREREREKEEEEFEEKEEEEEEEEEEDDFSVSQLSQNKLALQNIVGKQKLIAEELMEEEEKEEEDLILQQAAKVKPEKQKTAKSNLKRPFIEKNGLDGEDISLGIKKKYRTNLDQERKIPQKSRQPIFPVEKQAKPNVINRIVNEKQIGKRSAEKKREIAKEVQIQRKIQQLKAQEELKKLKEIWQYDATSLLATETFSLRNYTGGFEYDPNLCLYVDMNSRFRQFVHEKIPTEKKAGGSGKKYMKFGRLSYYSEKYGISLGELIPLFNSVSCDLVDLEKYLNKPDKNILWTAQEDKDLLENNVTALRYITRIKGPERMKKRRDFLFNVSYN